MYRVLIAAAGSLALAAPIQAETTKPAVPATPEAWRAAAALDLVAIHDILRDNAPAMVVTRDSAPFRRWLETGLSQAQADLPKVADARGYYSLLRGYVVGFRDSHIQWGPNSGSGVNMRAFAWPGFVLGWDSRGYAVAYRSPDRPDAPPLHARLVGCDGRGADEFVRTHDRYDGDFNLPSGRYRGAVGVMLDRGNPFVSRPATCSFQVAGERRTFNLDWRTLDAAQTRQIDAALSGAATPAELGIEPWGAGRWWITIPSMGSGQDWNGFYDAVKSKLAALRAADTVVIDLRGNSGGNSGFGDRLARMLWTDALVDARMPDLGPTVWRVSKANRDDWAEAVDRVDKDPNYTPQDRTSFDEILALYDAALAKGEPTFTLRDEPVKRPAAAPPNPMKGRVVLLTDFACNSACLDLLDEFTALPRVVQAGTVTSADTIFMDLVSTPSLPSGLSALAYGRKAWIARPRGSNVPYAPSPKLTWKGSPSDDAGIRAWLAAALADPGVGEEGR
jgi:hypothetical protein